MLGVGHPVTSERTKDNAFALHGNLTDVALAAPESIVRVTRPGDVRQTWVSDSRSPDPQIIRQEILDVEAEMPGRVVLVLDGTRGMEEFYPAIAEALERLPQGLEVAVLLAADGFESVCAAQQGDATLYRRLASRVRKISPNGGHDNVPALLRAWDLAVESPRGLIVWVHGPQPVLLDTAEELRQRFERHAGYPQLCEIQTQAGPNRIAEKLDGLQSVRSVPRLGKLSDDLARLFTSWRGNSFRLVRERFGRDLPTASMTGKETASHLARLWARDEVQRMAAARRFSEATQIAARYQLVTALSGAVVLETNAQFERAGLKPADPATVPVVPEPATWMLLSLALVAFIPGLVRKRGQFPSP